MIYISLLYSSTLWITASIHLRYCDVLYFYFLFSYIDFLNQVSYKISKDTYFISASSLFYSIVVRNLSKLVIAAIESGGNRDYLYV